VLMAKAFHVFSVSNAGRAADHCNQHLNHNSPRVERSYRVVASLSIWPSREHAGIWDLFRVSAWVHTI
jgi:hypothetical protein